MKIIGCDFHPSFQQIAMVDMETGEYTEKEADAGGGAAVLCRAEGAGAGGHGGLRQHAVVRASAGVAGYRVVAGRCRQDPGPGSAQAEDGPAGCAVVAAVAAGEPVSASMGADTRAARHAAVTVASPQAGWYAAAGEERVAAPGAESGSAAEAQAVERRPDAQRLEALPLEGLDDTAARGFAGVAGRTEPSRGQAGCGGAAGGRRKMRWRACCRRIRESVRSRRWRFR